MNHPTKQEREAARAKAMAASPGPWATYGSDEQHVRTDARASEFRRIDVNNKEDAAHIASSDPTFVLRLLDQIDDLGGAYEVMRAGLITAGHTKLKPAGTWPTTDEMIADRQRRVSAAQVALADADRIMFGVRNETSIDGDEDGKKEGN